VQKILLLEERRKIGEGGIAAEYEIKWPGRRLRSQVLMEVPDALTVLRLYAIKRACPIEGLFNERDWQFTQASCPETGFLRACKHCRIGICSNDGKRNATWTRTGGF